jgi:hypothetical protein
MRCSSVMTLAGVLLMTSAGRSSEAAEVLQQHRERGKGCGLP